MSPHCGITLGQLESRALQFTALRDEMLADSSPGMSFLSLPQDQLTAYEEVREASELGRIFKVANGLHDQIDAVVVLARSSSIHAAKGLFQACCDPYHNELSRAARGSKPRMYFAGFDFDNDDTKALLSRLAAGGYGNSPVEKRWAIIVVDADGKSTETHLALRHFLFSLRRQLGEHPAVLLKDLVIPQLGPSSELHGIAKELGVADVFHLPPQPDEFADVLSPVGLLPAAMLALDCMKLLAGAVAATEHFAKLRFKENLILRYVALNHLVATELGRNRMGMKVWSPSLQAFAHWYQGLVASKLARQIDVHDSVVADQTIACDLVVSTCRQDSLAVDPGAIPASVMPSTKKSKAAVPTFSDMMSASIEQSRVERTTRGHTCIEITVPRIDTHGLGQLIQFWLITTELQRRLN